MEFNIYDYIELENLPKLIIVEGFDFVGKTYFIDKLVENNDNLLAWKPKYGTEINNLVLPYSDRYALNIGIIDLIESNLIKNKTIVVDRGLLSGMIYNKLYNQGIDSMKNLDFLNYVRFKYSDKKLVHHIYIRHYVRDNAIKLYKESTKRKSNESYDNFGDYNKYIMIYRKFDECYKICLDEFCRNNYTILSSLSLNHPSSKSIPEELTLSYLSPRTKSLRGGVK